MASANPPPPHWKVIREILRHYVSLKEMSSQGHIENEYIEDRVVNYNGFYVALPDLIGALATLSVRKKEAIFYHVILDMTQAEAGQRMGGITSVSVGQYVKDGCIQLVPRLFPELEPEVVVPVDDTKDAP